MRILEKLEPCVDRFIERAMALGERLKQSASENSAMVARLKVAALICLALIGAVAFASMAREVPSRRQVTRAVASAPPPAADRQAAPGRKSQAEPPRRHPLALTPLSRGTPFPTVNSPASNGRQALQASSLVASFFRSVGQGRMRAAYRQLSPAWQRSLDFDRFSAGYRHTDRIRCHIDQASALSPTLVRVAVTLNVVEEGQPARYVASYLVLRGAHGWRLDRGMQMRVDQE